MSSGSFTKNAGCEAIRKDVISPSCDSRAKKPVGSPRNDRKCPPIKSVGTEGGMTIFDTGFIAGEQKQFATNYTNHTNKEFSRFCSRRGARAADIRIIHVIRSEIVS